ncbi:MAG TPA: four helix bundle protein [Fimbriimonas sp.]
MSDKAKTEEFRRRTRQLGIDVLRLIDTFPRNVGASVVARQSAKSATSVGANYGSACMARSTADMVAKLHIVEEEADETAHWLSICSEVGYAPTSKVEPLEAEARQLLSMTIASLLTLKSKRSP